MLIVGLSRVFCFVVFAHLTESKVYMIHNLEDEKYYIETEDDKYNNNPITQIATHRPKRSRSKHAVLHFGRPIYHLDSFEDFTNLRSHHNQDYFSYDYFDVVDRRIPLNYLDIGFLALAAPVAPTQPTAKCKTKSCRESRKSTKEEKNKENEEQAASVDNSQMTSVDSSPTTRAKSKPGTNLRSRAHTKRFQVVNNLKQLGVKKKNRRKSKKKDTSSEEYYSHKKTKSTHRHHRKKKHVPESSDEENKESNSYDSRDKPKLKKTKPQKTKYIHSSEEDTKIFKKMSDFNSESAEVKFDSNSIEESLKKNTQKKEEKTTSDVRYLQGNRVYNENGDSDDGNRNDDYRRNDDDRNNDDRDDEDGRRRLEHFLPKRYHWYPAEMKNLGYFWFNGPKGQYSAPRTVG